ncbi:MAG: cellulose synthase/poly-beta-1,6-N-acetylglucosamine synthase-like glycosyltransferase [Gammaproteobacteria bacterium]|jgi:cellulose synthase/poly-beta-1,6-N-acetylglucosamine synthase-like glycosyltransferase
MANSSNGSSRLVLRALLVVISTVLIAYVSSSAIAIAVPNTGEVANSEVTVPVYIARLQFVLMSIIALLVIFMLRHLTFTLNRLFGHQRHPYLDIDIADWPRIAVFIPAHNEEAVIEYALNALVDVDYPHDRLRIVPIDDRSEDRTWDIIQRFQDEFPHLIYPVRRVAGKRGKAAAIMQAGEFVDEEIIIVFDADYVPGRALLKQLAAPFFDPEVGAVMGRVVPHNTSTNLLTRLLDLERSGGYQVDQQARMNLRLLPQYGGSVGGVRVRALNTVGGWREDALAEDTDLTYRLLLHGYKVVYENRSECYEEVPETWQERNRQIMRWAKGHNQAAFRYAWRVLFTHHVRIVERIDALLLLGVYAVAPLLLLGWICALVLYFAGHQTLASSGVALFAFVGFGALGNFAAFFEIAAALHLDGSGHRVRLLPLNFLSFIASLINITRACFQLVFVDFLFNRDLRWQKTKRYRK